MTNTDPAGQAGNKVVYGGVCCGKDNIGSIGFTGIGTEMICSRRNAADETEQPRWRRRYPEQKKTRRPARVLPQVDAVTLPPDTPPAPDVVPLIRMAYTHVAAYPGAWVSLERLRNELAMMRMRGSQPDIPNEVVDEGLCRMMTEGDVSIIPESNQKTLTAQQRNAAVWIGNQWKHLIAIGDPDPEAPARIKAALAGGTPIVPDHIREAINNGDVGQVAIYCDNNCGTTFEGDFTGATVQDRLAAARKYLATQGWDIDEVEDICPACGIKRARAETPGWAERQGITLDPAFKLDPGPLSPETIFGADRSAEAGTDWTQYGDCSTCPARAGAACHDLRTEGGFNATPHDGRPALTGMERLMGGKWDPSKTSDASRINSGPTAEEVAEHFDDPHREANQLATARDIEDLRAVFDERGDQTAADAVRRVADQFDRGLLTPGDVRELNAEIEGEAAARRERPRVSGEHSKTPETGPADTWQPDGRMGTAMENLGNDRLVDIDGEPLINHVSRIRHQAITGAISAQEELDAYRGLRDRLPLNSRAHRAVTVAVSAIETPWVPLPQMPRGTPLPVRKLVRELHEIPLARSPHDGTLPSELDLITSAAEAFSRRETTAGDLLTAVYRLTDRRHPAFEGSAAIRRAATAAYNELRKAQQTNASLRSA